MAGVTGVAGVAGVAGPMPDSVRILLVEDNPADVELMREMLGEARISNELHVVEDGDQATDFLRRQGDHSDAPDVDLILLDLNLPRKDGKEVLQEIKSDEELRRIPVVVLTSSPAQEDVVQSYDLHCNAYVRKPVSLEGYHQIVRAIDGFWFQIVRMPTPD